MVAEGMSDAEPSVTKISMLPYSGKAIRFKSYGDKNETFCSSVNPMIVQLAHSGTV